VPPDPNTPFVSYAQNREDVVLFRALRDVKCGFYIDVGAHDPDVDSVTKAFYDRGWQGINVEPVAYWYQRLAAARPRDINLKVAIASEACQLVLHEVQGTGLSTIDESVAAAHHRNSGFSVRAQTVPALPLSQICQEHGVREIHFLKVDVEGAERAVLESMDLGELRPWIVVVEAVDPVNHAPTHDSWEPLLLAAGYEFALFDGLNRFYFDQGKPFLRWKLSAPANVLDNYILPQALVRRPRLPAGFGINLIGQFSSSTGLGISARHLARTLLRQGIAISLFDDPPFYGSDHEVDPLLQNTLEANPEHLPHPVNLYVTHPGGLQSFHAKYPALFRPDRFHAAVIWWETTALPAEWMPYLCRLDAIVGFSGFIRHAIANLVELTPVLEGRQPIEAPMPAAMARGRLGIPDDATVFVTSFDPQSDPARKNPTATLLAFRQAFPAPAENVRLLVRLNHAAASQWGSTAMNMLLQAAGGDPRIGFLNGPMSHGELHGLIHAADVYISLHRAEGLGLGPLEAMALGKPVIATGWSGNMSFMDSMHGCLVRYRPAPVSGNRGFYRPEVLGPGAIWAEPVIEDAVAWMRRLHANPEVRQIIGSKARDKFLRHQKEAEELGWLHELATLWQNQNFLPRVADKFSSETTA